MNFIARLFASGIINVLGSTIVQPLLGYLSKRTDADLQKFVTGTEAERDTQIAHIRANAEAFHEQQALAALRWGWWGTRYLLLAAALPAVYHSGMVYLDSCPFFLWWPHEVGSWSVGRAPGVYEGQELQIMAAVVGYQLGQTLVGGVASYLTKKRA